MVEEEVARPRAAAPRARRQVKIKAIVAQAAAVPATPEQELEQLTQYARKMSKSSKAEAMAFLQRAGIMDSKGNIKKEYCA